MEIICNKGGMQAIVKYTENVCEVSYEQPIHTTLTVTCEREELGGLLERIFSRKSVSDSP